MQIQKEHAIRLLLDKVQNWCWKKVNIDFLRSAWEETNKHFLDSSEVLLLDLNGSLWVYLICENSLIMLHLWNFLCANYISIKFYWENTIMTSTENN
jgi:hypothetical protein